jgi:fluoride exporter
MTLTPDVLVGTGATVGSVLRYAIGSAVSKISESDFPWGTWCVNVVGSFLFGVFYCQLRFAPGNFNWWLLLGTGFCGGFTTFSTMSLETLRLLRSKRIRAVVYLGSSLGVGCLLVWIPQIIT